MAVGVLVILSAAFTWLPQVIVTSAGSGEFEVDINAGSLGLDDYVVEWALLTVPRHGAYHAEVEKAGGLLSIKFSLGGLLNRPARGEAGSPLAVPVVAVRLTDFDSGKTVSLVIPSSFILSLKMNRGKPLTSEELYDTLSRDPLKALRLGKVVLGPRELAMLKSLGLVRESAVEKKPLSEEATARILKDLELEPRERLCGGGVYHIVNTSSSIHNEKTPRWWRERFVHFSGDGDADFYWGRFRDYLAAGYYLVSAEYSLDNALSCITRHINPYGADEVSLFSLESFVGANGWRDTYPVGGTIYSGPIPLFAYEIRNSAGEGSARAFEVLVTLDVGVLQSSLSGLLAGGYLLSASESVNVGAASYSDTVYAYSVEKSVYALGAVTSLGDHILVSWEVRGPVDAGNARYWVLVPRAVILPLYTVALDLGKLYVYEGEGPGGPEPLAPPGVSVLLDGVRYGPENFSADPSNPVIFRLDIGQSSAGAAGFDAVLGSPVFRFATAVFDNTTSAPYEKLATRLASTLLDTGYIHASFRGTAAFLHFEIIKGDRPRGEYSLTLYNEVPRPLDGVNGVDNLVWDKITLDIQKAPSP